MTSNSSMSSFCFNNIIRSDQDWCHKSEWSITLSYNIWLDISIVVLASPYESSVWLNTLSNHVINKSVFIPDFKFIKLWFIILLKDLFEDILESAIILLQDSILCAQVKRELSGDSKLEASMSEFIDWLICVIHAHQDSISLEIIDFVDLFSWAILWDEFNLEFAWLWDD